MSAPAGGALESPVPIIDISPAAEGADGLAALGRAVDEACRRIGFFVVVGHGVQEGVIDDLWAAARAFFDLPLALKRATPAPSADYAYGYSPVEGEVLARSLGASSPPDLKESLNIGPLRLPAVIPAGAEAILAEPRWPERPAALRPAWEAYFEAMADLAGRLLTIMAVGLGLPAEFFEPYLDDCSSAMRAINYPEVQTAPLPGQLRAGAHTDYGTLSILRFDDAPGGLEVKGLDGWATVPATPGGFVVNLGDMMARWTNDRWVSTLHRAGLPPVGAGHTSRRQSVVFFHNVAWDAEVRCLPTCLAPGESPRYEPVLAGPHLLSKFASTVESGY
ncbi:MAG: isopenicillin N synthase family oxygenase [bacterium]|nr:isopenicillin N synthase family oxygenase [bacterium]MDE0667620.1 isopenicillin N synthase family oxygenase [bacterium]